MSALVSLVYPWFSLVGGAFAAGSMILALRMISGALRWVCLTLLAAGGLGYGAAWLLGAPWDLAAVLSLNQWLIAMLVGLTFLRLLPLPARGAARRPTGVRAMAETMLAAHLIGSVVNIAAVSLVGHGLRRHPLSRGDGSLVGFAFALSAFWSPIWVGYAAVAAYAPSAQMWLVSLFGLGLAVMSLGLLLVGLHRAEPTAWGAFSGFALSMDSLRFPALLMGLVLVLRVLLDGPSIVLLVLVAALCLSVLALGLRHGRSAGPLLTRHLKHGVTRIAGEVAVFASAGFFGGGVGLLLSTVEGPDWQLGQSTGVWLAWAGPVLMVGLAVLGVHPLVSLVMFASAALPMGLDPTLFAMAGVIGWGASLPANPLSGLNLLLGGAFGVNVREMVPMNVLWSGAIVLLSLPLLMAFEAAVQGFGQG
ncbi:hypothetical protein [Ornithinimicrobium cavernae]|uniref:hypothetical protein n=1 Tax=Ornithinimicrobium cavernae TaxID=2666047 RepID=UPI0012B16F62|nr:hypothetical protein [Ornithinimicrobium cavernae]